MRPFVFCLKNLKARVLLLPSLNLPIVFIPIVFIVITTALAHPVEKEKGISLSTSESQQITDFLNGITFEVPTFLLDEANSSESKRETLFANFLMNFYLFHLPDRNFQLMAQRGRENRLSLLVRFLKKNLDNELKENLLVFAIEAEQSIKFEQRAKLYFMSLDVADRQRFLNKMSELDRYLNFQLSTVSPPLYRSKGGLLKMAEDLSQMAEDLSQISGEELNGNTQSELVPKDPETLIFDALASKTTEPNSLRKEPQELQKPQEPQRRFSCSEWLSKIQ